MDIETRIVITWGWAVSGDCKKAKRNFLGLWKYSKVDISDVCKTI